MPPLVISSVNICLDIAETVSDFVARCSSADDVLPWKRVPSGR